MHASCRPEVKANLVIQQRDRPRARREDSQEELVCVDLARSRPSTAQGKLVKACQVPDARGKVVVDTSSGRRVYAGIPGATGSTEAELAGCDRDAVEGDAVARDSGAYPFRQWAGVCCPASAGLGTSPLDIEPGSPWENGYCESFNGKLREECLNGEIFYSLKEARIVIEQWRQQYNRVRPQRGTGFQGLK